MATPGPQLLKEEKEAWDLDEVLTYLKFGPFQLKNLVLIGLLIMFSNLFPLSYTLTAADLEYRCFIPECETRDQSKVHFMAPWVRDAVPFRNDKPWKCRRFKNAKSKTFDNECAASFNSKEVENCDEWVYATDEVTIVREFGILCEKEKWKLPFVGSVNNFSQLIGIPLFGVISDKFGRKSIVIICSIMSSIFGILRGFSTSYHTYLAFEFMDSFFGCAIYSNSFVLGIELVNPKIRPWAATVVAVFYPFGAVFIGSIAWYFQNWRTILIFSYAPGLLFALYFWLIPESIRWLHTKGRYKEARDILDKISKSNQIKLPEKLLSEEREQLIKSEETKLNSWKPLITAFQSKHIVIRLMNCSFSWFATALVYYGLSIHSVELVGNKYLNFILINGIEAPAVLLSGFIIDKMKRKPSQSIAFFLSGVSCILCESIPTEMVALRMTLYLISKFLISISFCILFVYTAEMFPTELRQTLSGIASTVGRIGSIIAPQTILMKEVAGQYAAVLLFGVVSLTAGGLSIFFPETYNKELPDTVDQAKMENKT